MAEEKKEVQAVDRLKIGSKVKDRRQRKRLTLEDLAAKTGLTKAMLTKIEKDETVPPLGTLLKTNASSTPATCTPRRCGWPSRQNRVSRHSCRG